MISRRFTWFLYLFLIKSIYFTYSDSSYKGNEADGSRTFEKLGTHKNNLGVTVIGKFSMPHVFYGHFVYHNKPVLMKGALQTVDHPGISKWTDEYLRSLYGNEMVKVETTKKENREKESTLFPLRQFLFLYQTEDFYLVHSLKGKMADLALVPETLQCGGFEKLIQESVVWMGSGETHSVLHYDNYENLICVLDGEKQVLLADKYAKDDIEQDGFDQVRGYSYVDVENVDVTKFPRLANVVWRRATLHKGDCLYIPQFWYHQVSSYGDRHLAVNYWFPRLFWFDKSTCLIAGSQHESLLPISNFGFASPNEALREQFLRSIYNKGLVMKMNFSETFESSVSEERKLKFFDAIDKSKDKILSWKELYQFDIDKAIIKFPDVFNLPGSYDDNDQDIVLYQVDEKNTLEAQESNLEKTISEKQENGASESMIDINSRSNDNWSPDSEIVLGDGLPLPDDSVDEVFQTIDDKVENEKHITHTQFMEEKSKDGQDDSESNRMFTDFTGAKQKDEL